MASLIDSTFTYDPGGSLEITLNDLETDPENVYRLTNISGFDTSSEMIRVTQEVLPGEHGIEDYETYFGKRVIVFEGKIEASSDSQLALLEQKLRKSFNPVIQDYKEIHFTDPYYGPLQISNAKTREIKFNEPAGEGYSRSFRIIMDCKDPRIEGQTNKSAGTTPTTSSGEGYPFYYPFQYGSVSGSATFSGTNSGNFQAYPVITVYGVCAGPRIENTTTGKFIDFTSDVSLGAGDYLIIDCALGTVTKVSGGSSTNVYQYLVSGSEFWTVEPGVNNFSFSADSMGSGANITISFRDTYL